MNIIVTDEQRQMRSTVREAFDTRGGIEFARRQLAGDDTAVDDVWEILTSLDLPAMAVPTTHGGLGERLDVLGLLLEEVGRFAPPGPIPETVAFGIPLITSHGTREQRERLLPRIADGDLRLTMALYDETQMVVPDEVSTVARPLEGGVRLSGSKSLVPYGQYADQAIVAVRTATGGDAQPLSLVLVDLSKVSVTSLDSLDRTRPMARLNLDGHEVPEADVFGSVTADNTRALERAVDRFSVATCSMLVGAADRTVDRSVDYGNSRKQYGHPIGRFQAVKHRMVDMWADVEKARELVRYATWALATDDDDADRAVAAAASFCGRRCPRIFGDDIKNHGGQGFTWDHDTHIYLKQAKSWANFLGGPHAHRDRVIDELGL